MADSQEETKVTVNKGLTDDEKQWVTGVSAIMAKIQSLLVVAIMMLHENSVPAKSLGPDGREIQTQGLIDSCAFVSCISMSILKYVQNLWNIELKPHVVFGYMNFLQPKSSEEGEDIYASVPHLWVETVHERVAELCAKATGDTAAAERERLRITDIAGGVTHNREKRILGRPFHARMGQDAQGGGDDDQQVVRVVYSKTPMGSIPPGLERNVPQMMETAKNPLDTLRKYGGTRGVLMYKSLVKKLQKQAHEDDVGRYKFNTSSIDVQQVQA